MKIIRVNATPIHLSAEFEVSGKKKATALSLCLVDVESDTGVVGTGMTAITEEEVIATIVDEIVAPNLLGMDPMRHEQAWEKLLWLLAPRGQSGYAYHAISAVDLALWDLKGKVLGQPCWQLMGGARDVVPVYVTFGFNFFDREELAAAATAWVSRGFTRLKMTVGHHALQRRDEPRPQDAVIREDVARVRAVREAVGPDVDIYIDANCSLDYFHALALAQRVEELGISFFEEPVSQNDIGNLVKLRGKTPIPLAGGQNEGLASRFRDFLAHGALDVIQANACISGGFTQCLKIAGMAQAFNTRFANGGAWPHHNMHLHAALANGTLVEYHAAAVKICEQLFDDLPVPEAGTLRLPDTPGLGFSPNPVHVAELARRPLSKGRGKA